jgi:hypothetical protein
MANPFDRFDAAPAKPAKPKVPVRTRQQEIEAIARRRVEASKKLGDVPGFRAISDLTSAAQGAFARMTFGLPERLVAGVKTLTGLGEGESNQENLAIERAATDMQRERSPTGNILGTLLGAGMSGGAVTKGVQAGGKALTAAAPQIAQRTGKTIQAVTTLQKGQKFKNILRVAAGGAAGGGAQALGEGSDVKTGLAVGAAAPVVLGATAKGARGAYRLLTGNKPVDSILSRIITSSPDVIEANRVKIRAATGAEPTIYEALPLGDRQAFDEAVSRMPASTRENLMKAVQVRAKKMVQETASRTKQIIRPYGPEQRNSRIASDLGRSRGGAPTPDDIALAERASRSPVEMEEVRALEARNIMEPFDNREAYEGLPDLLPQHPVQRAGGVDMEIDDPDVASMIRSAAGVLRLADRPVTIRDITDIMSELSDDVVKGGIEGRTAQRAINHLEDILARDHPDVLPAITRMREAFAGRSRMLEGVGEGAKTRVREDVPVRNRTQARSVRNVYDTPEGMTGRALGQTAQLERDILTSPTQAFRTLSNVATDPTTQRAIAGNLGEDASGAITKLAETQAESARRLGNLAAEQTGEAASTDPVKLMQNLLMLSPATLPGTKIQGLARLTSMFTRLPEAQSNQIVEMLFSQNPTQISRAIGILSKAGAGGQRALDEIAASIATGQVAASGREAPGEEDSFMPEDVVTEEVNPFDEFDEEDIGEVDPLDGDAPQPDTPGNLPLGIRYQVQNPDGSISTVRTLSFGTDEGEVLIPTVINNKVVSDKEAIDHYYRTGEHFGIFKSPKEADIYADALHKYHAQLLEGDAPYGRQVIESIFPDAEITDDVRDPLSSLGQSNPGSYHVQSDGAVDLRPIPGMSFEQFVQSIQDAGYEVVEAIDETRNPSSHATGPHWHIVLA